MGNFAQMSLPLADSATLTIIRVNHTLPETITVGPSNVLRGLSPSFDFLCQQLPYRSRIGTAAVPWTDSASFRQNNCVAVPGTNGVNINDPSDALKRDTLALPPVAIFRQQPRITSADAQKHAMNVMLDTTPPQDIALPPGLAPVNPMSGSTGVSEFHLLADGKTGVLALGSFSENSFDKFEQTLLTGLTNLKTAGATQLIVDVVRGSFDVRPNTPC